MDSSSTSIRAWAQRLLALEEAIKPASGARKPKLVSVCEKLRVSLTKFIGPDGFTALLRRALSLARVDVPSLETVTATADGRLEGVEEFGTDAKKDREAAIAISTRLLSLMVTFIGEALTLRLMRDAFPDLSGRTVAQSEDLDE